MNRKIVLASGNAGKLKEFQNILREYDIEVLPQSQFEVEEVLENGLSFVENAIIKARHACRIANMPALADDSGIEVDALNGAPGIFSARYSEEASDQGNNEKLLAELQGIPKERRSARYQCVLVYMRHALDPTPIICQGSWEGFILQQAIGSNGFGYDPLFYIPTHNCSSAQLSRDEKNRISHRAIAIRKLVSKIGSPEFVREMN